MSSSSPSSLESTVVPPTPPLAPTSRSAAAPRSLTKGLSNPTSTAVAPRSPLTPSDVNVAFTATKALASDTLDELPASSADAPIAVGGLPPKTAERSATPAIFSDTERKHSAQRRSEKDAEMQQRLRVVSDGACTSADTGRTGSGATFASTPYRPQDDPDQVHALRVPVVLHRRVVNGGDATSSGLKGGDGNVSGTGAALSLAVGTGATTKPAAAKPSAAAASLSTTDTTDAARGNTAETTAEATPSIHRRDACGTLLTPRRRYTAVPPQPSVSPLTAPSTISLSSDDDDVESSLAASQRKGGVAQPAVKAGSNWRDLSDPQTTLTAPCRPGSGTLSAMVAAARARLAASSPSCTPRPSAGSLAVGASTDGSADGKSADATAVTELRELRQALKEKERELVRLERDVDKAKQSAAKAQKKSEELQGRLESEKSAFAAHKKGTLAQKHELQRELRQAQAALRSAEQAQDKLQRDLDKQREKLATASSHTTSTSTTLVVTPRPVAPSLVCLDTTLQEKVSSLENDKKALRDRIGKLEEQLSVAAAAVGLAKTAEEQRNTAAAAATEAAETVAALKEEVMNLRQRLASQDATVRGEQERAAASLQRNEVLEGCRKEERRPAREDVAATTRKTAAASAKGEGGGEGHSLSMRSPHKTVTPATPTKEAMAHLQEELTAAQRQAGVYKRMLEYAERRIEQLQTESTAARHRAEALEEEASKEARSRSASSSASATATTAILRDRIASLRGRLASVTAECGELRECVRERTEEATTLQSALQQAEDERDAKARQIRDLQSRVAKANDKAASALAVENTELSSALARAQAERQSALDSARVHQEVAKALRSELDEAQKRCSDLETRQAAQREAEVKATVAAEASRQQAEGYKKKIRQLTRKLNEALRELAVLGEEYERVCGEREKVLLRPSVGKTAAAEAGEMACGQPAIHFERSTTTRGTEAVAHAVSPVTAKCTDSVSRNLSAALLSAQRLVTVTGTASTALAIAAPGVERQAREQLEADVLSLYSKMSAIDHLEQSSPIAAGRGGAGAVAAAGASSTCLLLESTHDQQRDPQQSLRMHLGLQRRARSPGRARSPRAAHALDTRYFDPTVFTCSRSQPRSDAVDLISDHTRVVRLSQPQAESKQRSRSMSAQALKRSPSTHSRGSAQSPHRGLSPRSVTLSTPVTALRDYRGDSIASPAAMFSELPAASVYYSTSYIDSGAGQRAGVELQFSATAGRLLLSKRGRCVQRLLLPVAVNGEANLDVCCTAIGSISHTIYASHMSAKGHYHLKHTFRFIIRILSDCESGDILVGFADRYVPLETFGAKRNALHYRGCYYLSLRKGHLFCPAQDICDARYKGWRAAAPGAAERRWGSVAGPRRDGGASVTRAQGAGEPPAEVSATTSPEGRHARSRPQRVAHAGDEIACTLHIDERSIRYSWNGVECGVAFTQVSLSPSLYPCVEVNASGGAVELLCA